MKAFIVANYASGVGKCALFMPTVERVLQKENIEYSVFAQWIKKPIYAQCVKTLIIMTF